jgi:hypothetical protein
MHRSEIVNVSQQDARHAVRRKKATESTNVLLAQCRCTTSNFAAGSLTGVSKATNRNPVQRHKYQVSIHSELS